MMNSLSVDPSTDKCIEDVVDTVSSNICHGVVQQEEYSNCNNGVGADISDSFSDSVGSVIPSPFEKTSNSVRMVATSNDLSVTACASTDDSVQRDDISRSDCIMDCQSSDLVAAECVESSTLLCNGVHSSCSESLSDAHVNKDHSEHPAVTSSVVSDSVKGNSEHSGHIDHYEACRTEEAGSTVLVDGRHTEPTDLPVCNDNPLSCCNGGSLDHADDDSSLCVPIVEATKCEVINQVCSAACDDFSSELSDFEIEVEVDNPNTENSDNEERHRPSIDSGQNCSQDSSLQQELVQKIGECKDFVTNFDIDDEFDFLAFSVGKTDYVPTAIAADSSCSDISSSKAVAGRENLPLICSSLPAMVDTFPQSADMVSTVDSNMNCGRSEDEPNKKSKKSVSVPVSNFKKIQAAKKAISSVYSNDKKLLMTVSVKLKRLLPDEFANRKTVEMKQGGPKYRSSNSSDEDSVSCAKYNCDAGVSSVGDRLTQKKDEPPADKVEKVDMNVLGRAYKSAQFIESDSSSSSDSEGTAHVKGKQRHSNQMPALDKPLKNKMSENSKEKSDVSYTNFPSSQSDQQVNAAYERVKPESCDSIFAGSKHDTTDQLASHSAVTENSIYLSDVVASTTAVVSETSCQDSSRPVPADDDKVVNTVPGQQHIVKKSTDVSSSCNLSIGNGWQKYLSNPRYQPFVVLVQLPLEKLFQFIQTHKHNKGTTSKHHSYPIPCDNILKQTGGDKTRRNRREKADQKKFKRERSQSESEQSDSASVKRLRVESSHYESDHSETASVKYSKIVKPSSSAAVNKDDLRGVDTDASKESKNNWKLDRLKQCMKSDKDSQDKILVAAVKQENMAQNEDRLPDEAAGRDQPNTGVMTSGQSDLSRVKSKVKGDMVRKEFADNFSEAKPVIDTEQSSRHKVSEVNAEVVATAADKHKLGVNHAERKSLASSRMPTEVSIKKEMSKPQPPSTDQLKKQSKDHDRVQEQKQKTSGFVIPKVKRAPTNQSGDTILSPLSALEGVKKVDDRRPAHPAPSPSISTRTPRMPIKKCDVSALGVLDRIEKHPGYVARKVVEHKPAADSSRSNTADGGGGGGNNKPAVLGEPIPTLAGRRVSAPIQAATKSDVSLGESVPTASSRNLPSSEWKPLNDKSCEKKAGAAESDWSFNQFGHSVPLGPASYKQSSTSALPHPLLNVPVICPNGPGLPVPFIVSVPPPPLGLHPPADMPSVRGAALLTSGVPGLPIVPLSCATTALHGMPKSLTESCAVPIVPLPSPIESSNSNQSYDALSHLRVPDVEPPLVGFVPASVVSPAAASQLVNSTLPSDVVRKAGDATSASDAAAVDDLLKQLPGEPVSKPLADGYWPAPRKPALLPTPGSGQPKQMHGGAVADSRPPLLGRAPPLLGRAPPLLGDKPSLLGPCPSNVVPLYPERLADKPAVAVAATLPAVEQQTSAADDPMNRLEELVLMVTKLGEAGKIASSGSKRIADLLTTAYWAVSNGGDISPRLREALEEINVQLAKEMNLEEGDADVVGKRNYDVTPPPVAQDVDLRVLPSYDNPPPALLQGSTNAISLADQLTVSSERFATGAPPPRRTTYDGQPGGDGSATERVHDLLIALGCQPDTAQDLIQAARQLCAANESNDSYIVNSSSVIMPPKTAAAVDAFFGSAASADGPAYPAFGDFGTASTPIDSGYLVHESELMGRRRRHRDLAVVTDDGCSVARAGGGSRGSSMDRSVRDSSRDREPSFGRAVRGSSIENSRPLPGPTRTLALTAQDILAKKIHDEIQLCEVLVRIQGELAGINDLPAEESARAADDDALDVDLPDNLTMSFMSGNLPVSRAGPNSFTAIDPADGFTNISRMLMSPLGSSACATSDATSLSGTSISGQNSKTSLAETRTVVGAPSSQIPSTTAPSKKITAPLASATTGNPVVLPKKRDIELTSATSESLSPDMPYSPSQSFDFQSPKASSSTAVCKPKESTVKKEKKEKKTAAPVDKNVEDIIINYSRSALKPHYHSGRINPQEYKIIMKKAIAKIGAKSSGDVVERHVVKFINAYVDKVIMERTYT